MIILVVTRNDSASLQTLYLLSIELFNSSVIMLSPPLRCLTRQGNTDKSACWLLDD